jgi:DNA-binding transcriptional LysR family regulator
MQLVDRIGRRMKLHDLNVLMTVVQTGSMLKAAERLNTVQPAISRSIAELERALGVRLLDRHRKGVEPTEYGRALLDCGVSVFDALRQGVKSIESLADPQAGEVRIGCGFHLAPSFVSAVIERVSRRFPRVVFHIVTKHHPEELYRDLQERAIDLMLARRSDDDGSERLAFDFLFDDPYFVVVGKNHPWANRRKIKAAELAGQSWVLPPVESPPGAAAIKAFRAGGLDAPQATVFAVHPEVRMSLLMTGRFMTIFSNSALRFPSTRPALAVLPVTLALPPVSIGIITLKNRTVGPASRLFIEHAREVAKSLGADRK